MAEPQGFLWLSRASIIDSGTKRGDAGIKMSVFVEFQLLKGSFGHIFAVWEIAMGLGHGDSGGECGVVWLVWVRFSGGGARGGSEVPLLTSVVGFIG